MDDPASLDANRVGGKSAGSADNRREGLPLLHDRPNAILPTLGPGETLWTRANLREVLPDLPSPLVLSLWRDTVQAMEAYYRSAGLPVGYDRPLSKEFNGRIYFNASLIAAVGASIGAPPTFQELALGHGWPSLPGADPYAMRWGAALRNGRTVLRLALRQVGLDRRVQRIRRRMERLRVRLEPSAGVREDETSLADRLAEAWFLLAHSIGIVCSISGALMGAFMRVGSMTRGRVDSVEGFIGRMTAPGRKTVSAEQGLDFLALARTAAGDPRCRAYFDSRSRNAGDGHAPFSDYAASLDASPFLESFRNFLARYGHRGVYETDLARPRFREDPSYLLESLAAAARREDLPDLLELERNRLREAREAWLAFTARLGTLDRLFPWRAVAVRWVLRQIKVCQNLREGVRSEGMRVIGAMRRLSLSLGHRWFEGGWLGRPEDIFYLDRAEIDRAAREPMARKALRALVAARQEAERRWRAVEMPNLICEGQDGRWAPIIPSAPTAAVWRGLAVSGGRVRGPAAVVRAPDDVSKMRPGAVLVAPTTDPAWSALFALAAGVAVEMGGLLSHGSILAREYGIPAVVNVPGLCDAVRDGDLLEVDGWQGTVRRIGDGAEAGTAGTP